MTRPETNFRRCLRLGLQALALAVIDLALMRLLGMNG
jgi:hypothetical protein